MNFERSLGRIFFLIIIRALTTRRVAVCDEFYRVLPSFFFVCFASIFLPFLLRRPLSRYFLFRVLHFFFFFFGRIRRRRRRRRRERRNSVQKKNPVTPQKKVKKSPTFHKKRIRTPFFLKKCHSVAASIGSLNDNKKKKKKTKRKK